MAAARNATAGGRFFSKNPRPAWTRRAVAFSLAYLALGLVQRERAAGVQAELAAGRGHHSITRASVKPTIGNLILWRSLYLHAGNYYVDGIRVGVLQEPRVYPGESVPAFDYPAAIAALPLPDGARESSLWLQRGREPEPH